MTRIPLCKVVLAAATVAMLAAAPGSTSLAVADELVATTAEDHEARARIYLDKAKSFLSDAAKSRVEARAYREVTNQKGRRLDFPHHKKIAVELEAMAKHDELLAKDAERIADFHSREVARLRSAAK